MLGGDRGEIEAENPVRLEEDCETFGVGDRWIDRAPPEPRHRGREVEVVGKHPSKRFEPPRAECGVGRLPLRYLRPMAHALPEVIERFGGLPERAKGELHPSAVVLEQALVA